MIGSDAADAALRGRIYCQTWRYGAVQPVKRGTAGPYDRLASYSYRIFSGSDTAVPYVLPRSKKRWFGSSTTSIDTAVSYALLYCTPTRYIYNCFAAWRCSFCGYVQTLALKSARALALTFTYVDSFSWILLGLIQCVAMLLCCAIRAEYV